MANKMLIDATHPEETRVVVLRGNRVEEFDFESANRRQLRGNIYLAKVTRVEPSLQAAFVDYGGNRHGFLAFSEIHPDYYQIPVADRQALLAEERAYAEAQEAEENQRGNRRRSRPARRDGTAEVKTSEEVVEVTADEAGATEVAAQEDQVAEEAHDDDHAHAHDDGHEQDHDHDHDEGHDHDQGHDHAHDQADQSQPNSDNGKTYVAADHASDTDD